MNILKYLNIIPPKFTGLFADDSLKNWLIQQMFPSLKITECTLGKYSTNIPITKDTINQQ